MTAIPQTAAHPNAAHASGVYQLDQLAHTDVPWLWPGRIPLGRLTLLVGDPGLGKSLVTLDLAARVSRGTSWPDQCSRHTPGAATKPTDSADLTTSNLNPEPRPLNPPGSVLLLNAEDDLVDTVIPRLHAAGADCSRIVAILATVPPAGAAEVSPDLLLRHELARLQTILARKPDCRLVVIDPVSSYLAGSTNSSGEVRKLLAPLAQLAQQRNLALVAVSHLRKRDGAAIYRTLGSLTFVSSARAAWVITADPANRTRRLMLPIKNNLAAACGLAFQIESIPPLPPGEGRGEGASGDSNVVSAPRILWSPNPITTNADAALHPTGGRPRTERDDAIEWLKRKLADGPLPSEQIKAEADAHGIRLNTLKRAFRELNGEAVRVGRGEIIGWFWRLPAE